MTSHYSCDVARREVLRFGLYAGGLAALGVPMSLSGIARAAEAAASGRILVVVELSGANDGLNTVVPHRDDAYYRARPRLGIRADKLRKIDDTFGFQSGMAGFERLYKDGWLAIVHGVGYDQPSFSHFSSMAYWHTGAPNSGAAYGWLGRLADGMDPAGTADYLVNIDSHQSLAVRARSVLLVFDDPDKFLHTAAFEEESALRAVVTSREVGNPTQRFLLEVANSAENAEPRLRQACAEYRTPVDYGLVHFGLDKVAALIAAGFPTSIYYVAFRNNAFDTHGQQSDVHARLLTYTSDHIAAFLHDMDRIGRADDVCVHGPSANSAGGLPRTPTSAPIMGPQVRCSSPASGSEAGTMAKCRASSTSTTAICVTRPIPPGLRHAHP